MDSIVKCNIALLFMALAAPALAIVVFTMTVWYSCIAGHILSSCTRYPTLLAIVSIGGIDGNCCGSNDGRGLGRLDFADYYDRENSGKLNKGKIT